MSFISALGRLKIEGDFLYPMFTKREFSFGGTQQHVGGADFLAEVKAEGDDRSVKRGRFQRRKKAVENTAWHVRGAEARADAV